MKSPNLLIFCLMALSLPLQAEDSTAPEKGRVFDPREYHQRLIDQTKPSMAFQVGDDFQTWKKELREKLIEILALPEVGKVPLNASVTPDKTTDTYERFRVTFQSEPSADVPGFLLIPKKGKAPFPVMICLQGHAKDGMLTSLGESTLKGGRDIALQSIEHGWAALCIEQRGFAERKGSCQREFLEATLLGRTLTGERVHDVMRAIDFIETQKSLDASKVGCMGNSTGGTVTFYAACVDPRIRLAGVSCSYCTYKDSWMKIQHCACGYLPGILKVADMGDLGGLVAPRHLLIVAGKEDNLAMIEGVREAFARTKAIYTAAGVPDKTTLVEGDGGHQFYPEIAWPVIQRELASWKE